MNDAEHVAQRIVLYRKNFRRFANEQLKLAGKPLEFWPCQTALVDDVERQFSEKGFVRSIWLKARQVGSCLHPSCQVLTASLIWKKIELLEPGEALIGVDEYPSLGKGQSRRLRIANVVAKQEVFEPSFLLLLENGETLTATGEHRFLSASSKQFAKRKSVGGKTTLRPNKTGWRAVSEMVAGDAIRCITLPWGSSDYEDGWLGGILDGEGSFRARSSGGVEGTITQSPGIVLDRVLDYMKQRGYSIRVDIDDRASKPGGKFSDKPVAKVHLCRMGELFRLIGQTRPSRFSYSWWNGKALPGRNRAGDLAWSKIISITALGPQRMIDLQTTTGTYIAEGFVSHNSTLAQSFVAWRTMLWPNVNTIVLADEAQRAQTLFEISRAFYDHMDEDIRPIGRYVTKKELVFANPSHATRTADPGLRSRIVIDSAHKKNIGIGASWTVAMLSECARFRDPRLVIDGIIPAVHRVPGTMIIMESTAEQAGTWFRDFYEESLKGHTGFSAKFVPWYLQPEYQIPLRPGERVEPGAEERVMMREHGLTLAHIKWMREKLGEMFNDWNLFRQSFPLTPEDAWVTPGTQVFPSNCLRELKEQLRPPKRTSEVYAGPRILDAPQGRLAVWEEPQVGKAYDIGVDVASGVGRDDDTADEHLDPSVACVIERGTNRQVAEWASRAVDPFELATTLFWLGKHYNTAQIAVEVNSIGTATNSQLSKLGYGNVYLWRFRDEIVARYSKKTGWQTNPQSKAWLVGFSVHELTSHRVQIRSELLYRELETFVLKGPREWGAAPGHKDDRVMAFMIALLVSDDENFERFFGLSKELERGAIGYQPKSEARGIPEPWECDLTFQRNSKSLEQAAWD